MDAFVYLSTLLVTILLGIAIRHWLGSFRAQRPQEYIGLGPDFDPRKHLDGALICEGVIFGPTGRMTSRFCAEMRGSWTDGAGVLEEEFLYDSGARQSRSWHLTMGRDEHFIADADDIVGQGHGLIVGPTVRLAYRMALPQDAGGHTLDVIDWMYLMENGTIINRSQFRKFGLKVAELVATIRRDDTA